VCSRGKAWCVSLLQSDLLWSVIDLIGANGAIFWKIESNLNHNFLPTTLIKFFNLLVHSLWFHLYCTVSDSGPFDSLLLNILLLQMFSDVQRTWARLDKRVKSMTSADGAVASSWSVGWFFHPVRELSARLLWRSPPPSPLCTTLFHSLGEKVGTRTPVRIMLAWGVTCSRLIVHVESFCFFFFLPLCINEIGQCSASREYFRTVTCFGITSSKKCGFSSDFTLLLTQRILSSCSFLFHVCCTLRPTAQCGRQSQNTRSFLFFVSLRKCQVPSY
jgi:hypothetical protein